MACCRKWDPGRRREHPIEGERSSDRCWFSQSQSVQRLLSCPSSSYLFMFYWCTLSSGNTDGVSLRAVSIFHKFLDRYNIWSIWKMQYTWFYGVHSQWRLSRTALLHTVMSTACWEACTKCSQKCLDMSKWIFQNICFSFAMHFLFVSCWANRWPS